MAHFAKIDENNIILNIVVVAEPNMLNGSNVREESKGQEWLEVHNNWPASKWIEYSPNTLHNKYYDDLSTDTLGDQSKAFRGNGAVIGLEWDVTNEIFWTKQPHSSWTKDIPNAKWVSPIGDAPDDLTAEEVAASTYYDWDESAYQADNNTGWVKRTYNTDNL